MAQVTALRTHGGAGREANGRRRELGDRLDRELGYLSDELTIRIPGEMGQPTDTAQYRAVMEQQQDVQRRIRLLRQLIAGLPVVDPETIWDDQAGYGSVVLVRDLDSGHEWQYTLMAGEHIDIDENQVSLASPIGQALLGCRVAEEAVVITPQGRRRFRVTGLETLPQRLGLVEPVPPGAA